MRQQFGLGAALLAGMVAVQCGDSSTGPDQVYDVTGKWTAAMNPLSVSGPCAAGTVRTGTATITKTGGTYQMALTGGFDCGPTAPCAYTGTADGNDYDFNSSGTGADGTYAALLTLKVTSKKSAGGTATSQYPQTGGQCLWVFDFTLRR